MYVALKRIRVGERYRERDEPVPEATTWSWQTLDLYTRTGYLLQVPDPEPQPEQKAPSRPRGSKHVE